MGPVFPTTLGMVGDAFPDSTGTAIGIVTTLGWIGIAVSSWTIGMIAGQDPTRLGSALMILPVFALVMLVISVLIRAAVSRKSA